MCSAYHVKKLKNVKKFVLLLLASYHVDVELKHARQEKKKYWQMVDGTVNNLLFFEYK